MINIAVCDDDIDELERIYSYLAKDLKELEVPFRITSFYEGQDLIEHIISSNEIYDIIFLDIYMKFSNGIDIGRKIREFDNETKIIFITSSKDHAIDSYDLRALYYILKPISEEKLSTAVKIAVESLNKETKHVVIKNKMGSYRIPYKDILYAESKARVVNIYLKSNSILSFYSRLEDFSINLKDERFLKCHKSFLVNMNYILKIEKNYIFMGDNIVIPISGSNTSAIKEKYFNYLLKEV